MRTAQLFQEKCLSSPNSEPTSSMSNASFMELLTENANLSRKIALLEQDSDPSSPEMLPASQKNANEDNPWKKELTIAEQKIHDLQQVNMTIVNLIIGGKKPKLSQFGA